MQGLPRQQCCYQPLFQVTCFVETAKELAPLHIDPPVFASDCIAVAKEKAAAALGTSSSCVALAFRCGDHRVPVGGGSGVESGGGSRTLNFFLDTNRHEQETMLCALVAFSSEVVVLITTEAMEKPPSAFFAESGGVGVDTTTGTHRADELCAHALNVNAAAALAHKHIRETGVLRYQMEFSPPRLASYTPEYVFRQLRLNARVPFAMCRSYSYDTPCRILVYSEGEDGGLQRHWPFKTMRCRRTKRPKGILFYTTTTTLEGVTTEVEWLPNGHFRVSGSIDIVGGAAVASLRADLCEHLTLSAESAFAAVASVLPTLTPATKINEYTREVVEVVVDYNVYASVTDIRRLVDEEMLHLFFVESAPPSSSSDGAATTSQRQVCLMHGNRVSCHITRSVTNGILCQTKWMVARRGEEDNDDAPTIATPTTPFAVLSSLHTFFLLRYMISSVLPREFAKPHSTFGWDSTDPELYHSVKNSGISRKTWTTTDESTGCKRYRKVVPINPDCEQDMQRYNALLETGPLLKFRGFCYGAILDEEKNGQRIRELRKMQLHSSKKLPAKLMFFGLPVVRSIEEEKYRSVGYEGEEFRFVPACIKYQPGKVLSEGYVSVMAPLYHRGIIDYVGRDAALIKAQLSRKTLAVVKKYAIKTQKPLGPGENGELPRGPLTDYLHTVAPHVNTFYRKGVYQPEDHFFVFFHALLDACGDEVYSRAKNANAREECVADLLDWESQEDIARDVLYANVCRALQLNVVCFHYTHTQQSDMHVSFLGKRYVQCWDTVLLLRTGEQLYDIITFDGRSVLKGRVLSSRWVESLYKQFYPNEHQLMQRFAELKSLSSDGHVSGVVNDADNHLAALEIRLFCNDDDNDSPPTTLCIPVVQTQEYLELLQSSGGGGGAAIIKRVAQFVYEQSAVELVEQLSYVSQLPGYETLAAYEPHTAMLGPYELMVYAIRLADERLICPLATPMDANELRAKLKRWLTFERNTTFIGIPSVVDYDAQDLGVSLCQPQSVRECFCVLLSAVRARVTTFSASWYGLPRNCREARRGIQRLFVEPVLRESDDIPIAPHIMCAMLVAFCENHRDPDSWVRLTMHCNSNLDFAFSFPEDDDAEAKLVSSSVNAAVSATKLLQSPREYLDWLVMRR